MVAAGVNTTHATIIDSGIPYPRRPGCPQPGLFVSRQHAGMPTFGTGSDTPAPADSAAADQSFVRLAAPYLATFCLPTDPAAATSYGIRRHDGKLGDYSRAGIDAEVKALQSWEQRLAAIDPVMLGEGLAQYEHPPTAAGSCP